MSDTTTARGSRKPKAANDAPVQPKQETDDQKRQRAYAAATKALREENDDRFYELLSAGYAAEGLAAPRRKLTDEQKREQEARRLLAEDPGLFDRLVAERQATAPVASPESDGQDDDAEPDRVTTDPDGYPQH